jgi:hypothetical protein
MGAKDFDLRFSLSSGGKRQRDHRDKARYMYVDFHFVSRFAFEGDRPTSKRLRLCKRCGA